jgi:hypothetical protein
MRPATCLRSGHPLHSVNAALSSQSVVCAVTLDLHHCVPHPSLIKVAFAQQTDFESSGRCESFVHPEHLREEECGLSPTYSSLEFH